MSSAPGHRFALVVGTERYDDADFHTLRAPSGDVVELARVLSDPDIGRFDVRPPVIDQPAHVVTEEIEAFFADRRSDDFLLLYISCHGVLAGDRRLYFAATNTKRHRIRATGISDSFVNDVMRHSRARRIVLVLDCCHSGAFARGLVTKGDKDVGLEHRFEGRGRVTLTASTEIEYAFEGNVVDDLGHPTRSSIFTRALVDGLRTGEADRNGDGHVSIDELYDYVFERVRAETTDQTPGMSGDVRGDIFIASTPRGPARPPLPPELLSAMQSPLAGVREGAVVELGALLHGTDRRLADAAREHLHRIISDDSRSVSRAAERALSGELRREGRPVTQQASGEPSERLVRQNTRELPQAVTIIDLGTGYSEHLAVGIAPDRVWVAPMAFHSALVQIDPRSNELIGEPVQLGMSYIPLALVICGQTIFVLVAKGLRLALVRVDIASGHVASPPEPVGWLSAKVLMREWWGELIAVQGSLWAVTSAQQVVTRLDPQRSPLAPQPTHVGYGSTSLAGDEGGIWLANKEAGAVTRIDPGSNEVIAKITVGTGPADVAVGEAAVWVANSGDATVSRIDPSRNEVVGDAISVGRKPICITAGAGYVWVGNHDDDTVSCIDPASHAVVGDPIPVARGPYPARFGHGAVWVGSIKRGAVTRIVP